MVSIRTTDETVRAGDRELIHFAFGECSLGTILVAATGKGVCAILLGDDRDGLRRNLCDRLPTAQLTEGGKAFEPLLAEIVALVETPTRGIDLPLDLRGTDFQRRVWQALREIPAGTTASYREIADRIGASNAVRAVARACAANALAVAIPCHRVVRADGARSGYRWGMACKQILLDREAA
jgi:AraC family transcriptional regulator of adaptative response/methylated-DNA-[protein]-cysteine methyltransferase